MVVPGSGGEIVKACLQKGHSGEGLYGQSHCLGNGALVHILGVSDFRS